MQKVIMDVAHASRNSSVGRALDWRSKGPWFNPGFRHSRNTRRSTTFSPGLNHLRAWNSHFCIKPMWRHIYTCPKLLKIGPVNVWWRKHVLPLNWWFHCEYLLIEFSCELRHHVTRFFSLNDGRIRTWSIIRDTPLFLGYLKAVILDSIVVSIPACHAGDRGSIPRRGDNFLVTFYLA